MAGIALSFFLPDDAATASFGAAMAKTLRPGDLALLKGDLGSGKTAMARALIRPLLLEPALDIPSPSFALVQPYEGQDFDILHADLYRINDPREIDELGLDDDPKAICLVEWPERAPELYERATYIFTLSVPPKGQGRNLELAIADPARNPIPFLANVGFQPII